ncbi:MAG: hypothetical protein GY847_39195 [Proteobacteria bacterium]|nr:hypothetical protein [Pseudomonadota bacterium]
MDKRNFYLKCATDEELSAFLEGNLDTTLQDELKNHLDNCKLCQTALSEIEEITVGLATLGDEKPPEHLWSKIEQEHAGHTTVPLTVQLRHWWEKWWTMPAVAIGAAAATTLVLTYSTPSEIESPKESQITQARALDSVMSAEQVYTAAIDSLEKSLSQKRPDFNSDTQKVIDQSLVDINTAIERCRMAISRDPNNIEAHRTALAAYQQKVDLLTDLVVDPL